MEARTAIEAVFTPEVLSMTNRALAKQLKVNPLTVKNWRLRGVPAFQLKQIAPVAYVPVVKVEKIPGKRGRKPVTEMNWRDYAFIEMYKSGKTLQEIGTEYGVSRERVRQVISKFGVTRVEGGSYKRRLPKLMVEAVNKLDRTKARRARWEKYFGCAWDEITRINGKEWSRTRSMRPDSPCQAYYNQKHAAIYTRKIGFELTLPEWWRIWQESGHWEQRGRGQGYCMTRIGDTGPYAVDNVEIKTIAENFSESFYKHPASARWAKVLANRAAA